MSQGGGMNTATANPFAASYAAMAPQSPAQSVQQGASAMHGLMGSLTNAATGQPVSVGQMPAAIGRGGPGVLLGR
jgi:hypothetical protein